MVIIGIICLVVAVISALRTLNNGDDKKWQKSLAIVFLILGLIIIIFSVIARH
ncbi:hypothetical protein GCM10022297_00540 [Lactobacillus hamsteri]|uniref:Uncharacterized protein n=1 Tax=Lactobacillus hamsteri DSM 5661 = JCM 6256 TaxID=1423754 RepID=A0A0R1Y9B3_9LACO|nr:hypothetical protein [Lactobacillus hamsteri]KRM39127.1 hypothetical protein FC39_GL001144 [Lactobacillus hamsteri DSM 5661 = JCM 6256]